MTYFQDLTSYTYHRYGHLPDTVTLNVGWLDGSQPFTTGVTGIDFHRRLLDYCRPSFVVVRCRGLHECQFCEDSPPMIEIESRGETIRLGYGEIRVLGDDVVYAAPTLIYHYVVAHNYCPPAEFMDAVVNGPPPGSPAHRQVIEKLEA